LTKNKEHITDQLDSIEFHDVPVSGIYIQSDEESILKIDYFLYVEDKSDYDEYSIVFSAIENADIGQLTFSHETDMEIFSFDYNLENDLFDCNIMFLLGFGKPSLEIKIKCGNISIIKDEHNKR
jgi:hypothetical protein